MRCGVSLCLLYLPTFEGPGISLLDFVSPLPVPDDQDRDGSRWGVFRLGFRGLEFRVEATPGIRGVQIYP